MDVVLAPAIDVLKHYIKTHYLTYEDKDYNTLLSVFISALLAFISRLIIQYVNVGIFDYKWIMWYIKYHILFKKEIIVPYRGGLYPDMNLENPFLHQKHIMSMKDLVLFKKLYNILCLNRDTFMYLSDKSFYYQPDYISNLQRIDKSDICYLAYVNGFPIAARISSSYLYMMCPDKDTLDYFSDYIMDNIHKLDEDSGKIDKGDLSIVENSQTVGKINKQLTLDHFVSRHKPFLMSKLKAFKEGHLHDHPYIQNNLGILLYGPPGTGKSFFVVALANYAGRSLYIFDAVKNKKKSQLRNLFTEENNEKYVYYFNEVDFLLSDLLNKDQVTQTKKEKIASMSNQLSVVKDNKEMSDRLVKEIKTLMEEDDDLLTYEFLLSELSGLTSCSKRIIVMDTNFPEKIPEAFKRPGRCDIILGLTYFNNTEIKELLQKLYPHDKLDLDNITFKENTHTPAHIINMRSVYDNPHDLIKCLV